MIYIGEVRVRLKISIASPIGDGDIPSLSFRISVGILVAWLGHGWHII